jgi:hypothetical protein
MSVIAVVRAVLVSVSAFLATVVARMHSYTGISASKNAPLVHILIRMDTVELANRLVLIAQAQLMESVNPADKLRTMFSSFCKVKSARIGAKPVSCRTSINAFLVLVAAQRVWSLPVLAIAARMTICSMAHSAWLLPLAPRNTLKI